MLLFEENTTGISSSSGNGNNSAVTWMDGCLRGALDVLNVWMEGCMDGWMQDGWMHACIHGCIDGQMGGWMHSWMDT
jgi:hypothetical protein